MPALIVALDVQPLSRLRRALLLGALALLFAGSLGFAELLVRRHTPVQLHVTWNLPQDFKRIPGALDHAEGVEFNAVGIVRGRQRELAGLVADIAENPAPNIRLHRARQLFTQAFGDDATLVRPQLLGGQPAIELEASRTHGNFALLRMAAVDGKAVAICYSGAGPITDGDRSFLNQLCAHVEIRTGPTSSVP